MEGQGLEKAGAAGPTLSAQVWAPLAAGLMMAVAGTIGYLADQPWLFPSLGPTAYILATKPNEKPASFYSTVVGHLVGFTVGLLAVQVAGTVDVPSVLASGHLGGATVFAAALAVSLNALGGLLLDAYHPPSAATTLLVALGSFRGTLRDTVSLVVGVLIVAGVGVVLGQVRRRWLPAERLP